MKTRKTMRVTICVVLLMALCVSNIAMSCPNVCTCIWKQGKQTVECVDKALISIPEGIKFTTQVLDLSGNNFQILPKYAFRRAKLGNLQKIYLRMCKLGHIDSTSFSQLTNLIELDLSVNLLTRIPSKTFKDFPLLRRLVLNKNPIRKIEDYAFIDLTSLSNLELNDCQIESIEPKGFVGLEHLQFLKIQSNNLFTIRLHTLSPLISLHGLELHNNPWRCDCKMREVRKWMLQHNVPYGIPPRCSSPVYVDGKTWDRMNLDDFACIPTVPKPLETRMTSIEGENATIPCHIKSVPEANIKWTYKSLPVTNRSMTELGRPKYLIREVAHDERSKTSYLTILSVDQRDNGSYLCTAVNNAGRVTSNFTLAVGLRILQTTMLSTPQLAGIILGVLLIFLLILIVVCLFSARWRQRSLPPRSKVITANNVNHIKAKEMEANSVPVENSKHAIIKENSNFSHESTCDNGTGYTNPNTNMDSNNLNGPYMSPERTVNNYCVDINDIRYPTYPKHDSSTPINILENSMNKRCLPDTPNQTPIEPTVGVKNPVMMSSAYSLDKIHVNSDQEDYIQSQRNLDLTRSDLDSSVISLRERDESYGSYYPSPSFRTPNSRTKYLAHMPPSAAHLHMIEIGGGPLGGARDSPDEGYGEEGDEGTEV